MYGMLAKGWAVLSEVLLYFNDVFRRLCSLVGQCTPVGPNPTSEEHHQNREKLVMPRSSTRSPLATQSPNPSIDASSSTGAGVSDEVVFKVVLLGSHAVGKTCLVDRVRNDVYRPDEIYPTIGVDFSSVVLPVKKPKPIHVRLQLWDTAGKADYAQSEEEQQETLSNANAIVMVFDTTNAASLHKVIDEFLPLAAEHAATAKSKVRARNAAGNEENNVDDLAQLQTSSLYLIATHSDILQPGRDGTLPVDTSDIEVEFLSKLPAQDLDINLDDDLDIDAVAERPKRRFINNADLDSLEGAMNKYGIQPEQVLFLSCKDGSGVQPFKIALCRNLLVDHVKRSAATKATKSKTPSGSINRSPASASIPQNDSITSNSARRELNNGDYSPAVAKTPTEDTPVNDDSINSLSGRPPLGAASTSAADRRKIAGANRSPATQDVYSPPPTVTSTEEGEYDDRYSTSHRDRNTGHHDDEEDHIPEIDDGAHDANGKKKKKVKRDKDGNVVKGEGGCCCSCS